MPTTSLCKTRNTALHEVDRLAEEHLVAVHGPGLQEIRQFQLRELRKLATFIQTELAGLLHVSQNRVSAMEQGRLDHVQIDTLRRYVEALGGHLRVSVTLNEGEVFGPLPGQLPAQIGRVVMLCALLEARLDALAAAASTYSRTRGGPAVPSESLPRIRLAVTEFEGDLVPPGQNAR